MVILLIARQLCAHGCVGACLIYARFVATTETEYKKSSQKYFQEGFNVLRTGIEPVRTFLSTGF